MAVAATGAAPTVIASRIAAMFCGRFSARTARQRSMPCSSSAL
jgi:hypothetical protein